MATHDYNNPQHFNVNNAHRVCDAKTREKIKSEIDKITGNCMDENVLTILVDRITQIVREGLI